MSNAFTETTTTSYGNALGSSIKGVVLGFVLFILSFVLLYWNEGRTSLFGLAKTATEISATALNKNPSLTEKLVATTGTVTAPEKISDHLFLNPGAFLAVKRDVEMYAWTEHAQSREETHAGGSTTTETTYRYSKAWEENPTASTQFKQPEGHENPQKTLNSAHEEAHVGYIGIYPFDPKRVTLPSYSKLALDPQNITLSQGAVLANGDYLFLQKSKKGQFMAPEIGDLRVSYWVVPTGFEGTLFGKLDVDRIAPYQPPQGLAFYQLFIGPHKNAMTALHTAYTTGLWAFRLLGFLLMWFGLASLLRPITLLLNILPVLGLVSRLLIGLSTLVIALILSGVTIVISILVHF